MFDANTIQHKNAGNENIHCTLCTGNKTATFESANFTHCDKVTLTKVIITN